MKQKKQLLCFFLVYLSMLVHAQNASTSLNVTEDKGIKWVTSLSWEQIKQKAKAENKYIFLDCFTTWCGPCKMLDKTVFINDTIGDFFNQHFISVKVQMDKTNNDDKYVKDWYKDASAIQKEYIVNSYPTALFFSPNGIIVHKDGGFKPVQDFISAAKLALTSGKVYDDPYAEYKRLVNEYNQGIKHYDRMAYMVKIAFEQNDGDFARALFKDHLNYASALNENERYTRANIEVWASFIFKPGSKVLGFFLKDGDKIDKAMNQKGYTRGIVDKSIQSTIVDSFFRMQKGETTIVTGDKVPNSEIMFMQLPIRVDGRPGDADYVEADWKTLESMIRKYFNSEYASRNVLTARYRWYEQHQNRVGAMKVYFMRLAKWHPAKLELATNEFAWYTFLYSNDRELLKEASEWQAKLIQQWPGRHELFDTYAGLLYKLGRTEEAIQMEEKAIAATAPMDEKQNKIYRDVIEKMTKGEPTYVEEGAIWLKNK